MRCAQLLFAILVVFGTCLSIHMVRISAQDALTSNHEEYEFVEDTDRWVHIIQGETQSIGKLDNAGNFIPDKRWFQLRKGDLSSVPPRTLINLVQKGVYEFRSRRLIPG